MIYGKVKALKDTYGFLQAEDGREAFFLPIALVPGPKNVEFAQLKVGQRVRFDTVDHPRGLRAVGVEIVE